MNVKTQWNKANLMIMNSAEVRNYSVLLLGMSGRYK